VGTREETGNEEETKANSQQVRIVIGQEELVSCSSDYSSRWLAIRLTFNNV
jgi:hypothetical protein